ncbi:MAG: hypothetical protein H6Q74_2158 [Firmicutes bacterium]|nr:hypothetical protein [Bacillota bacterium]
MTKKNKALFWIMLGLTTFTIFFNLGAFPLLDPDETVYAETPKEMIAFDDFVSPRIYGEYWYDKPPMYYWLVAASFKIFGINEFAARFPSALFGVLCVWLAGSYRYDTNVVFNGSLGFVSGQEILFVLFVCGLSDAD